MEAKYYVAMRPRTNEMHGVHKEGCPFLEDEEKSIFLGKFRSAYDAERAGLKHFSKTKCCAFCAKEIKTAADGPFSFAPLQLLSDPRLLLIEDNAFYCSIN
jgi:hypothetical protein